MRKVIFKTVRLPASGAQLFAMYLDSSSHSAITGFDAELDPAAGSSFRAFGGLLHGTTLQTVPSRLIVQSWRSVSFREADPDSLLVLAFSDEDGSGRIDLLHVNVPEHDFEGVSRGWDEKYFEPWRAYLQDR